MNPIKFAVALLIIALFSCEEEQKARFSTVNTRDLPTHISKKATVVFMDSNFTKAILKAGQARIYDDRQATYLDSGIVVEFMSRTSGKRVSLMTADSAYVDDKTKDMTARGNVVVVSDSSGTTLRSQTLMWSNSRQKLYTNEFVTIVSPKERIQGYGFESDQNLGHYVIFKVSGETR